MLLSLSGLYLHLSMIEVRWTRSVVGKEPQDLTQECWGRGEQGRKSQKAAGLHVSPTLLHQSYAVCIQFIVRFLTGYNLVGVERVCI
jgi:hypothetical protein